MSGACERNAATNASAPKPAAAALASKTAPAQAAPTQAATASAAGGHFGAPLSAAPAISAQEVLADPAKYDGKDIKISGLVSAACQRKGCWMTLGDGQPGQPSMRVTFKDYGFFVPKDCMGKIAVVEGHFKVTTLSVAQAQHYASEAPKASGAAPPQITAPQRSLSLLATGVDLL